MVAILWSLILAKCFTLDFLVHIYQVPVNTAIYVWLLSCGMALAATYVHAEAKIKIQNLKAPRNLKNGFTLLLSAIIISVLIFIAFSDLSNSRWLLVGLALLLIAFNLNLFNSDNRKITGINTFIWLATAIACIYSSLASALAIFGLSTLASFTLPLLIIQIQQQREIKSALNSLH